MRFIHMLFLLFSLGFFFSCNPSEQQIQNSLQSDFIDQKDKLNSVIKHVVKTYYNKGQFKELARLQFVLGDKTYQRRNIFSDSIISYELKNTSVAFVFFEKNSMCLGRYQYDMVRFKLKVKKSSFQYYYVYEFCPQNSEDVDGSNFKSIRLDNHWAIEVEKS